MDITLVNFMNEQLSLVSLDFKRYMYEKLPWEARLVGLMGPRGVGKSTMILQRIKEMAEADQQQTLYISAYHSYFTTHTFVDTADEFVREGGKWLFLDEVHKYDGWSRELKQIYDSHPELHIFFTGSSVLDILEGEADLSRRALLFDMQGLSFREYLELFHGIKTPVRSLEDVLDGIHVSKAFSIPYHCSTSICVKAIIHSQKKAMCSRDCNRWFALLWK